MKSQPETIENRWDILYAQHPEIYEAFASVRKDPDPLDVLLERFDFRGKVVADVGGGTGKSAFGFARHALRVFAIEPETAMRNIGIARASELGIPNVEFVAGDSENTLLPDSSVDMVTAITAWINVEECLRILKPGGVIVYLDTAPGWYGGELCAVIDHATEAYEKEVTMNMAGFDHFEFDTVQEYGTTKNIVSTYGFIFGKRVIDYLRNTGKTCIQWRIRVYHRQK